MPRIIKRLRIDEVSAVVRAANPGATMVLRKADDAESNTNADAVPDQSNRTPSKLDELASALMVACPEMNRQAAMFYLLNTRSGHAMVARHKSDGTIMNKVDTQELFGALYSQLDASERRRWRAQQREIDALLAEQGVATPETEGRGGGRFNGRTFSTPDIAPGAPRAPKFEKTDSLTAIIKQVGLMPLCKLISETGDAHRVGESELMQHASQYAAAQGTSLGKFLNSDSGEARMLCKAAEVCRRGEQARQAQRNIDETRARARGA
jgi:hypothetical protein